MSETQKQNIIDIQNIVNSLGETETQTAKNLLIKLLDATLMALIPEIDNLDIMSIDKKIKLVKYYSLNEEERNKISYNELYNEETLKIMEETANGINVSKPFDNVEDLFKELED